MSSSLVPTAAALLGTTIPFVASEHTVPEYYASRRAEYALLLLSFLRASAVTITSEAVRQSFPALVRNRMHAIPNPIIGARRFAYDVEGKMSAIKTILAVGRLGEEKDHRTLIQAFSLLAPRFPDWHLAIVGEGSLRPQLESLIRDFQLTDRVSLPGVSGNIAEVYSQAQLFVTPSLFEGFGLVTAEAMAHGLPVVGFADCPGTKELISDNHTGLLVRGQDRVTSLAEALERLMQDPGLRLRLAVEARSSLAHCALDRVVDLWETLLLSVAERQDNRAAKRSNETYF
jgi:glycosyltransferase involved in cell wall biosynthesis